MMVYNKKSWLIVPVTLIICFCIYPLIFRTKELPKEVIKSLERDYKRDELKYFSEIAFRRGKIVRWIKDIKVSASGSIPKKSIDEIKRIIQELSPLMDNIKLSYADKDGDITVTFVATDSLYKALAKGIFDEGYPHGFTHWKTARMFTEMKKADIYIRPDMGFIRFGEGSVLRHEFMHALGVWNHGKTYFEEENLMSKITFIDISIAQKWADTWYIPRLDKAAIKLLYDSRIPNGLDLNSFLKSTDTTN